MRLHADVIAVLQKRRSLTKRHLVNWMNGTVVFYSLAMLWLLRRDEALLDSHRNQDL